MPKELLKRLNSQFTAVMVEMLNSLVHLHVDIMNVNNIVFLLSVAKPINLLLCTELMNSRSMTNLSDALLSQISIIKSQGFIVNIIFFDEERGLA